MEEAPGQRDGYGVGWGHREEVTVGRAGDPGDTMDSSSVGVGRAGGPWEGDTMGSRVGMDGYGSVGLGDAGRGMPGWAWVG